jgi:hypothetical protein
MLLIGALAISLGQVNAANRLVVTFVVFGAPAYRGPVVSSPPQF